ncbi:lecithin retinol acyltransferase family protein [Ralstonia pseudosolanacearum]|nr:lecithin retinol acyltransferase family protein [Ralstonia pseudosolanacearum]MDO3547586.1 lecithin retinol acyltransferase family protein [Ralstonia pseudosolanacearum]MDO3592963.1 lecithin retinol acyltransferase family protein [Ralstonia pseudosolanacearum]MDO3594639.1 lecithin retinol acyltransferase family protein [Ralstonia pseudosolanacearum]UYR08522.1 lecithin retinol acyltransferase family protein [Ralstonia pseudosolanacearum]
MSAAVRSFTARAPRVASAGGRWRESRSPALPVVLRCTSSSTSAQGYDAEEVARRAGSRLGANDYRLLTNNCEHFCSWRLFGERRSKQVEACLKSPMRAVRTLFKLMLLAISSEWRSAFRRHVAA